jgi:hypothetical protein
VDSRVESYEQRASNDKGGEEDSETPNVVCDRDSELKVVGESISILRERRTKRRKKDERVSVKEKKITTARRQRER